MRLAFGIERRFQIAATIEHAQDGDDVIRYGEGKRNPSVKAHSSQARPQIVAPGTPLREVTKAETTGFNPVEIGDCALRTRALGDVEVELDIRPPILLPDRAGMSRQGSTRRSD